MDGGAPANGVYDFQFALFDDESAGTRWVRPSPKADVTVTDGLFTVELDFGSVFDGTALWLEIGVRPGSDTGAYTTLSPRQPLTPTPYALYASQAPWSGLNGVPTGFADGIDDGTSYTAGMGLTLSANEFSVDTAAIQSRVTGTCADGNAIRQVAADGSVTCEPVGGGAGTVTQIDTGAGLTGGPITTSGTISLAENGVTSAKIQDATIQFADINQNACNSGEVMKWDGAAWICGWDHDTTYTPGDGLELVGTQFKGKGSAYQQRRDRGQERRRLHEHSDRAPQHHRCQRVQPLPDPGSARCVQRAGHHEAVRGHRRLGRVDHHDHLHR